MNKKFKIVSSIALAGMLLTGGLGMSKVNAAETEYTTNPVAVYRKLVEGKTVVPFILANKDDVLTVKDIVESDMFSGKVERVNGNVVSSLDLPVGTGSTFTTTDGTQYTVVVYGDVDGDGALGASDAYLVEQYRSASIDLTDVQREAADIGQNNGAVDAEDSWVIKRYRVELTDKLIENLPPQEEVVEESNYSMTVNKGGYINNVNDDASTIEISIKETLDKKATLKLVVSDQDEATANVEKNDVEIPAHMDYVEVSGLDLSGLKDGTVTASLYDGDTLVAKYEIIKNATVAPNTANVSTNRVSTREATLSLESMGASNVTKVRYVVLDKDAAEPETKALTESLNVQNNKLTDVTIANNLETGKVYRVWYMVENEYGSISGMKSALITTDGILTAEPKLASVKAPDLTATTDAKFEFVKDEEDTASHTYVVTLYKDGVAIAEKDDVAVTAVSFTDEIAKAGVGTYKVSVVTKGNDEGTSESSEAVESKEITVTALKSVENLAIANLENDAEGNAIISWSNPNGEDDFGAYEIDLYTVDAEGKETLAQDNIACDNDKNEVKVTIDANKIYVAKVKLTAKAGQMAVIGSEEVVSDQFYRVEAPNVVSAIVGSTSIKIPVDPIEIPNKEVKYKVEVYNVNSPYDPTKPSYVLDSTRDVTLEKIENTDPAEYQVTIDGLDSTTQYAFRLVAIVDGNEVKSNYSLPVTTLPIFEEVTVTDDVDAAMEENSNKVAIENVNTIVMNGAKYDTTTITELQKAKTVIASLQSGDVVTMNDDASDVSIVLGGRADNRTFDTNDMFKDSTVDITSNAFTKTLIGTFKALTLNGTNSIFDVNGVTMADTNTDIVLTDGIEVTATSDKNYKVEAGAEVIINDVKVTTAEEVTLTAKPGKNLDVDANTTENDIVFENTTAGDAKITFIGSEDNTSEQRGTVTIKTTNGKVIVEAPKVNVSADMKVEVTNGEVEVTDASLTGDKTVTVSADEGKSSKVLANTVNAAPEVLKGETIDFATYKDTDEGIRAEFGEELSQADVIAIREYANSFGLEGTKAIVVVNDNLTSVEITLPGDAQNVTIGNLK